jgi:hypothetical protein
MSLRNLKFGMVASIFCLSAIPVSSRADSPFGSAPAPAPVAGAAWMHKGLRLTYHQMNGRGKGNFNESIFQQDICCVDGNNAIMYAEHYTPAILKPQAPPALGPAITGNAPVNATLDHLEFWLSTAQLDQYLQGPQVPEFQISRAPYKIGDQSYDGVTLSMQKPKFLELIVFDHKTGLLLHRAITSKDAGDVINSADDFVSMRDINIPWADEPLPDWLINSKILHYQYGVAETGMPGPMAWLYGRQDNTIVSHGNGWIHMHQALTMPSSPNVPIVTEMAWAPDLLAGIWAGPIALAKLQKDQVLDEDPTTKMRVVVTSVDEQSVTITESNGVSARAATYDKHTGLNQTIASNTGAKLGFVTKTTFQGRE